MAGRAGSENKNSSSEISTNSSETNQFFTRNNFFITRNNFFTTDNGMKKLGPRCVLAGEGGGVSKGERSSIASLRGVLTARLAVQVATGIL